MASPVFTSTSSTPKATWCTNSSSLADRSRANPAEVRRDRYQPGRAVSHPPVSAPVVVDQRAQPAAVQGVEVQVVAAQGVEVQVVAAPHLVAARNRRVAAPPEVAGPTARTCLPTCPIQPLNVDRTSWN